MAILVGLDSPVYAAVQLAGQIRRISANFLLLFGKIIYFSPSRFEET